MLIFLHLQRQHQFHDFQARFALLLIDRTGVNIERRAAAGMAHQLLSYFDINAERPHIRRQRMTEAMPADLFSSDSDSCQRRANTLLQNAVGTKRLGAFGPG